jgi:hypothetical protein
MAPTIKKLVVHDSIRYWRQQPPPMLAKTTGSFRDIVRAPYISEKIRLKTAIKGVIIKAGITSGHLLITSAKLPTTNTPAWSAHNW